LSNRQRPQALNRLLKLKVSKLRQHRPKLQLGRKGTVTSYPAQAKQAGGSEQKSSAEAAPPPEAPGGPSEEEES
jgi:hypothetical protein